MRRSSVKKNEAEFLLTDEFIGEYNSMSDDKARANTDKIFNNFLALQKKYCIILPIQSNMQLRDLTNIWIQLTNMSQCNGKYQKESLKILLLSLMISDFHEGHIDTLFYVLCSFLYKMRLDFAFQSHVSQLELLTLSICKVTSKRLYVHYHLNHFTAKHAFDLLLPYIKEITKWRECYNLHPLPGVIFDHSLNFCSFIVQQLSLKKENKDKKDIELNQLLTMFSKIFASPPLKKNQMEVGVPLSPLVRASLSISLFHAQQQPIENSIGKALSLIANEKIQSWIDKELALEIMKNVCQKDLRVFKFIQGLAQGNEETKGIESWGVSFSICYIWFLRDICLHSTESDIRREVLIGPHQSLEHLSLLLPNHQSRRSSSLAELAFFRINSNKELSWKIRHSTFLVLLELFEFLATPGGKDEVGEMMKVVLWCLLIWVRGTENDPKVLEALQMETISKSIQISSLLSFKKNEVSHKTTELLPTKRLVINRGNLFSNNIFFHLSRSYLPEARGLTRENRSSILKSKSFTGEEPNTPTIFEDESLKILSKKSHSGTSVHSKELIFFEGGHEEGEVEEHFRKNKKIQKSKHKSYENNLNLVLTNTKTQDLPTLAMMRLSLKFANTIIKKWFKVKE